MNATKKYELLYDDIVRAMGAHRYRIRALRDFGNVKKGDLGGYIAQESCLSHEGNCWVADKAVVGGEARIIENAQVAGNAHLSSNILILGNARIDGDATVCGATRVGDNAYIGGEAHVTGWGVIRGNAQIKGTTAVTFNPIINRGIYLKGVIDHTTDLDKVRSDRQPPQPPSKPFQGGSPAPR